MNELIKMVCKRCGRENNENNNRCNFCNYLLQNKKEVETDKVEKNLFKLFMISLKTYKIYTYLIVSIIGIVILSFPVRGLYSYFKSTNNTKGYTEITAQYYRVENCIKKTETDLVDSCQSIYTFDLNDKTYYVFNENFQKRNDIHSDVTVYYNPNNPEDYIVYDKHSDILYIRIGIAVILALIFTLLGRIIEKTIGSWIYNLKHRN